MRSRNCDKQDTSNKDPKVEDGGGRGMALSNEIKRLIAVTYLLSHRLIFV